MSPHGSTSRSGDGFTLLASVRDGAVRIISRNGHPFTNLFGPITDALRGFPTLILLDGEVIAINDRGQPDFEALQARLRNEKLPGHLGYMVFDCLHLNEHSLLSRPLEERRAVLLELQPALQTDEVKLTEGFPAAKSNGVEPVRRFPLTRHSGAHLLLEVRKESYVVDAPCS